MSTQKKLEIRQVKSGLRGKKDQKATLAALGLRKHQQVVVHNDTPQIRGMIFKIKHLLQVRELFG